MKEVENGPTAYPGRLKHFEMTALLSEAQGTEMQWEFQQRSGLNLTRYPPANSVKVDSW